MGKKPRQNISHSKLTGLGGNIIISIKGINMNKRVKHLEDINKL
jgi:hypothetical protein